MSDNINYNFKDLTPFKWFVLENFPFIEQDFDALTNWQLFCKLGKEMNKIINSQNSVGEQTEKLTNAFIVLKDYVDNYFANLDVQEEIDNKLDELVEDGTLQELVGRYFAELEEDIGELTTKVNAFEGNLDLEENERKLADNNLQSQIDELVVESGDSSAEVVQARTNTMAYIFNNLNARLDFIEKTLPFKYGVAENVDFNSYLEPRKIYCNIYNSK